MKHRFLLLAFALSFCTFICEGQENVDSLKLLAKQGNSQAQFNLGYRYHYGRNGVTKDYSQAVYWYRKAAEQGHSTAQCNLGLCYEYGKGVTQDYSRAEHWYKKAAAQGYSNANNNLAGLSLRKVKSQGYANVIEMNNGSRKYYKVSKNGRYGLTDTQGRLIVPVELEEIESTGGGYLRYKLNGFWGLMNFQGTIIIDTDRCYTSIGDYISFTKRFAYTMAGYKGECDAQGNQISKIRDETSKSTASSKSSSSTNKNSSGSQTQKVVVEHHRDPVPVQVWVQCNSCFGSGLCHLCHGGRGSLSDGSCLSCGYSGRCTYCAGRGGQYIVQYQ